MGQGYVVVAQVMYYGALSVVTYLLPLFGLFLPGRSPGTRVIVYYGALLIAFTTAALWRLISAMAYGATLNAEAGVRTSMDVSPFPDIQLTMFSTCVIYWAFIAAIPQVSRARRRNTLRTFYPLISIGAACIGFTVFGTAAVWIRASRQWDVLGAAFIAMWSLYVALRDKVFWLRALGFDFVHEPLIRQFRVDSDYYMRLSLMEEKK